MDTYNYRTMTREIFETYILPKLPQSKSNNKGKTDKYTIFLYILYKIENNVKWLALENVDVIGDGTKLKYGIIWHYYNKWSKDMSQLDEQYLYLVKLFNECSEDKKKYR